MTRCAMIAGVGWLFVSQAGMIIGTHSGAAPSIRFAKTRLTCSRTVFFFGVLVSTDIYVYRYIV